MSEHVAKLTKKNIIITLSKEEEIWAKLRPYFLNKEEKTKANIDYFVKKIFTEAKLNKIL